MMKMFIVKRIVLFVVQSFIVLALFLPFIFAAASSGDRVFSIALEGKYFDKEIPQYVLKDIFVGLVPGGNYYYDEFLAGTHFCAAQLFDSAGVMLHSEEADRLITQPSEGLNPRDPHTISVQVKYHPAAARLEFVCDTTVILQENVAVFQDPKPQPVLSFKQRFKSLWKQKLLWGWVR